MESAPQNLKEEIAFFDNNLAAWLQSSAGRVVLIKGAELIGMFDNESEALSEGARRFGMGPYLIRRVATQQVNATNLAFCLGLISAVS